HESGTKICLQLLHAGRYAYHPFCVAPSAIRSPISPFRPGAMSKRQIRHTIRAFARSAVLARRAGYDGVEVMGSEGYLINQFACRHTNQRSDEWGGELRNRIRFSVEIIRAIRRQVGPDWIIVYRLSMLDLLQDGNSWAEVVAHARAIEAAGATLINTGIGWHEVRIPTIASVVPTAAFSWVTKKLKSEIRIPLITSNRINRPDIAESCLRDGAADMVSMARPFLADAAFVKKTRQGRVAEINTCIACNQGCLDHVFNRQRASCLVNPRACYETEFPQARVNNAKTIIVVGLGVAGLACAATAAQRGHKVIVYDRGEAGGQFNLAASIPGKEDYRYTVAYFLQQLRLHDAELHLNTEVSVETLRDCFCDAMVIATGVKPRQPSIEGIGHFSVVTYEEAIRHTEKLGSKVAIIGAGGIGFDVAEKLAGGEETLADWCRHWGIDCEYRSPGGLLASPAEMTPGREIYLLQRKNEKPGRTLGKTTGWIHRLSLKKAGVKMYAGVQYKKIDDFGLHLVHQGEDRVIAVDSVVICAGQEPENALYEPLKSMGQPVHLIGGALDAGELNAERAIRQGMELAMRF
ncbi:MAG TPA: FAD-binding protein, partial [Thiotrichales bacterium]|nr:FAD-binding protein [Thiotrichales bacterium]